MKGLLFDIKRYSINDGPGIRITFFIKGCPLSCIWCHNPEGISIRAEKLYTRKKCIGCQICINACPQHALKLSTEGIATEKELCIRCGICTEVCPSMAMEISGKEYTADSIMKEIEKEIVFMDQSEGGVTFCGGEPLLHPELLSELLHRCGEQGIHRTVDTSLYARPEIVKTIMLHTELFLVDLKHMDTELHQRYCGVPNELILSNLKMIAEAGKDFFIRIPLIEGINADEENILRCAEFLSCLPWKRKRVNLLLYHDIGKNKHEKLGSVYNPGNVTMSTPSVETQQRCISLFKQYGIDAVIGG